MVNRSKQKGTRFESELVDYLRDRGFAGCERRALTGTQDRGDIAGIEGWTIEAKNVISASWADWIDQTEVERRNSGDEFGLLVVRRRMKPITQAYAVMRLDQMVDLMILTDQEVVPPGVPHTPGGQTI